MTVLWRTIMNIGGQCAYFPNPGNVGDKIIHAATLQFFASAGLTYVINPHLKDLHKFQVLIVGGGGSLIERHKHHNPLQAILACGLHDDQIVIVMPSTVRGCADLISRLRTTDIVFCRDLDSLREVETVSACQVAYHPDMALGFAVYDFLASFSPWRRFAVRSHVGILRIRIWAHSGLAATTNRRAVVQTFRRDLESTGLASALNVDLSLSALRGSSNWRDGTVRQEIGVLVGVLRNFDFVETDRLHVAIVAMLLNCRVVLFDNDYGKNSAVYQSSLQYCNKVAMASAQ